MSSFICVYKLIEKRGGKGADRPLPPPPARGSRKYSLTNNQTLPYNVLTLLQSTWL